MINGDFENGFTGWSTLAEGSAIGPTIGTTGTIAPGGTVFPASPTADNFAYTSQTGPGRTFIYQMFTVQAVTNSIFFDLYVDNADSDYFTPNHLDYSGIENQRARVDIMLANSAIDSLDPADIVVAAFETKPGDPLAMPWQTFELDVTADLTPYIGQDLVFRFSQIDNQDYFNFGIDNVNVGTSQTVGVPTPGVLLLLVSGLAGMLAVRRRNHT